MAFDWRKRKRPQGLRGLEPFSVGLNPPQAATAGKLRRRERAENQSGNKTKKPCKANLAGLIWWSVLDSNQ